MEEEASIVLEQSPSEDEELLVAGEAGLGAGQVGGHQRVHQEPRQPGQDELEILISKISSSCIV